MLDKLDCVVQTPSSVIRAQALYLEGARYTIWLNLREENLKSYPKTWVQQTYLGCFVSSEISLHCRDHVHAREHDCSTICSLLGSCS